MFGLGMQEILVILVIGIVLFGARRLPEIGAGLGKAIKNFKKGVMEPDEIEKSSTTKERTVTEQPVNKDEV
ncbi:MAG: twin-arginine translocase TatA/TatE family subunit [Desulfovibrionaceae bacterium]|nr:twin-arginine translocase TatA/TatE family subunit [Desulfovibrionaceae bacterium]